MKLPRLVHQHRISSPKSNIFSENFDFAVSLMFLKPNVKSIGVLKAKGKKETKRSPFIAVVSKKHME
jgi:hypothetical protein